MLTQESSEIVIEEKLEQGKCGAQVVDVVRDVLGPTWYHRNSVLTWLTFSDQPVLRFLARHPLVQSHLIQRMLAHLRGSPGG